MAKLNSTLIMSVKIVLMSTGVIFIGILFTLSLPQLFATAESEVPSMWATLRSWLRPPYLYFIINGIIITIAASSRLHSQHAPTQESPPYAPQVVPKVLSRDQRDVISVRADEFSPYGAVLVKNVDVDDHVVGSDYYGDVSVKDVGVVEDEEVKKVVVEYDEIAAAAAEEEVVSEREEATMTVERSTWTPPPPPPMPLMRQEALESLPEFFSERPPPSSRFGHHRRPVKASPAEGGKALRRVAKPKKHDTLESTWKAITEGRHIPLTRHLKKSDTWENNERQINLLDSSPLEVKKSQTFNDRTNLSPPPVSSTKLKKEPSLGQDELNRRVEAFINKFNEEMRLQRQESMQQFMEMINRAA